jgi:uncharacterized phage-associated protein
MASVHDVAAYILEHQGPMSTMRLQKLVYYCQAWHLVWDDEPLFDAKIEAWANGPVCPDLYREHRQMFGVDSWPSGDSSRLAEKERETIDLVLDFYGKKDAQWLSDLTHVERPWREARRELPDGAPGRNEIDRVAIYEYYSNLPRK